MNLGTVFEDAAERADQNTQAGLFKDMHVMVVSISHGPSARMAPGLFTVCFVNVAGVAVSPFFEVVIPSDLMRESGRNNRRWVRDGQV